VKKLPKIPKSFHFDVMEMIEHLYLYYKDECEYYKKEYNALHSKLTSALEGS